MRRHLVTFALLALAATLAWGSCNWSAVRAEETTVSPLISATNDPTYQIATPTAGQTVTMTANKLIIVPAGLLATLTVTLPPCGAATDGLFLNLGTTQALTLVTMNAAAGSVSTPLTTLTAGGAAEYICRASNTTWYKIG